MIALMAGLAHASELAPDNGLPVGPVQASLWDGALGRAQSPVARTEAAFAPRGYLLVDTPAFYGSIVASANLDASVAVDPKTEVSLRLEALRYQSAISAISSDFLGYGHTTVGVLRQLDEDRPELDLALVGQVVLPTAVGLYQHAWPVGLDAGLAGRLEHGRWAAHGQAGLVFSAAISKGASQPRLGVPITLGGAFEAGKAFAVALDLQSSFAYTALLDHLAVAPAVRFAAGPAWGLELGGAVPLVGRERALAAVELRTGASF